jgi:hypothetical protein
MLEINYTVQQTFHQPPVLFDKFGVPIRQKFDCMISYQWDVQEMVKVAYMNLHMKNISIWFDIWGGMQSNVNDSMATAVECSKVILVFLTNKYLSSVNCTLELKYAVYCGKPFVFLILETLNVSKSPQWIVDLIKEHTNFEVSNENDLFNTKINGISKLNHIAQSVRDIGNSQKDFDVFELSEKVCELKHTLKCGLDELETNTGQKRFKICTRCKKEYENDTNKVGDCKMHTAYYMGGTIIAGRWVCCNQTDKEAQGCSNTTHMDEERVWNLMKPYGTHQWQPA